MKQVWKWTLYPKSIIEVPVGAKILTIQEQNGEPQIWMLVDPDAPKCKRRFLSYGTGHEMPDDPGQYVGTFQLKDDGLVFHVFEVLEKFLKDV